MNAEHYRNLLAEELALYGRLMPLIEREREIIRRLRQDELAVVGRRKQRLLNAIARIDEKIRAVRPAPADAATAAVKKQLIETIRTLTAAQQGNEAFAAAVLARVTGRIKDVRQQIKIGQVYKPVAPPSPTIDYRK